MSARSSIFRDAALQSRFDEDGYVVMDFITPDEAHVMGQKFYEVHDQIPKGFYADAHSSDDELKNEIYSYTGTVFLDALEKHFKDYKILGGTYLNKSSDDVGKVGVHQDWTIVDESKYSSLTIWVPVQDVDGTNGAMRVVPGSHLFFDYHRSDNIPYAYRGNEQMLWDNMVTVQMRAGQAFVLNHAVIHASDINTSGKERLVIAYGLAPKNANLMFYYQERDIDAKVEKFDMPNDFFQRYYNVGQRPKFGHVVDTFDYPVPAISSSELQMRIERELKKRNMPINIGVRNTSGGWITFLKKKLTRLRFF